MNKIKLALAKALMRAYEATGNEKLAEQARILLNSIK
jgi:hypothetical protein